MKALVNHMRAVDVLVARDDVDANRIGATGHSLGGHNAIFLGVFDERVKVVVSSCGWTPFHDYYGGNLKGWTQDRYMPRIRDVYGSDPDKVPFDFPELIACIAPRAFFSASPMSDANFDVNGVKRGIAAAQPIYDLLGASTKLQARHPNVEHDFTPAMRNEAWAFVDQVLGNAPVDKAKKSLETEDFAAELPRIPPHEPKDALSTFQVLPGFHLELAASEPNVASPVAISFDENGRLFVCEMRDYSEQDKERLGTIRLLEDTDGDGTFDKATVFADGLSWPTGVFAYNGGVFVLAAPDVYWLKDTNGDGKADERKVVYTGFGRGNVQGLMNSLQWGLDNRIHGATSSSGGKVRKPEDPESKALDLQGRDFSFDPRTMELRAESGGAQHGMSFDDWGRKFVSSNSDHIQMVMIDERYLEKNPYLSVPGARESIAADGPQAEVFRISPVEPWRIVRTRLRVSGAVPGMIEGGGRAAGYFTGATGVTIYRGDAFPPEYHGMAFCGDVGSNIVHRKKLEPNGVGFLAKRVDVGKEFVASKDIWFRPAQFANAPDGTLYIIDVYRETIEHPASLPPMIKKHLDLTSGRDRGRLWRAAPDGFKHPPAPKLGSASTDELVKSLESKNGWTRDAAARLLYERQDKAAIPLLERLATSSSLPETRVHAMYSLAGLGALKPETVAANLDHAEAPVRENAIRLTELAPLKTDAQKAKLTALKSDANMRVRYQLALTAGITEGEADRATVLGALLKQQDADRWLRAATLALAGDKAGDVVVKLADDDSFGGTPEGRSALAELARQIASRNQDAGIAQVLQAAVKHRALGATLLGGLSSGFSDSDKPLRERVNGQSAEALKSVLDDARRTVDDAAAKPADRADALRLLPLGAFDDVKASLVKSIAENQPQEVQVAAIAAMDRFASPDVGAVLTKGWPTFTPAVRAAAANVLFARPERTTVFLDAIEAGKIKAADVDRSRLQALSTSDNAQLKARAKKLLASAPTGARQQVFDSFREALSMKGDEAHGKVLFEKTCAACHRLNNNGQEIGPNLAAMKARGAEAILVNVVDPNREVNPQFVEYIVQTKSGRTTSGLLAAETASGVTLKRAGGETETIARADIKRMRSSGLSLMPENLEQGLDKQAFADMIAYILAAK
jgi:putative membrane-bound dehydrogenase-like protein